MYRIFQQIIYGGQRFLLWVLLLCFGAFFISSQTQAQETSVCAEVKIVIEQKLSFERQAFDAKMIISNGLHDADVKDVSIELLFMDQNEQPVMATTNPNADPNMTGAKFFYRTDTLKGIESIEGQGQVKADSAAEIHWLIIPSFGASSDEGTLYYVGAKVTYTLNNVTTTVEVAPDYIVVKPQPKLTLDYFLPTDVYADDPFTEEVEPPVPFTLGVRISNTGGGAALKTSIESAQPRIVENKQNLLIDFKILGGYVSDEPAGQSLLLNFGDIEPHSAKVGRWSMMTTLSGKFVEFNANYSHADELGGLVTSLLQEVRTHTLVHDVKVDLPGRDNIRDFLALDADVLRVYESDGIDTVVTDQSKTAQLTLQGDSATISYQATPGFSYIKIDDSYRESRVPVSVVRSDGKILLAENIWLSKTRNEDLSWSYYINVFDVDSTGIYDITFSPNTLASISGMVFEDTNGNGVLDEDERGVGVAKVTLTGVTQEGNSIVTTAYTDVHGYFGFNQVQPGHYTLEVADAQGMIDIVSIVGSGGGVAELRKISGINLNAGMQAQGYYFAKQWGVIVLPDSKADLAMEITASTTRPTVGEQVTFTIRVHNAGPDRAESVKAFLDWPQGLTDVRCQANTVQQYVDGVWGIEKLDPNTTTELNCTAIASDLGQEQTVHAMVASRTVDPELDNNEAFVTLQAVVVSKPKADLSIQINTSTLTPNVGELVTFVYTTHNAGPDTAQLVQTTINWPNGLTDVSCEVTNEDQYVGGVWMIEQLIAGTSKELSCTAKVTDFNEVITITASITSQTQDENLSNNQHAVTLTARAAGGAKLSGLIYEDLNQNGIRDGDEPGLAGIVVTMATRNASGESVLITTQTDGQGEFSFEGLEDGTYTLSVADVDLMKNGVVTIGSAFGFSSNGAVNAITLTENTEASGYQFAKYKMSPSSLAGHVFYKSLTQTTFRAFEGATIHLSGVVNGKVMSASTVTDDSGGYEFTGLAAGVYKLSVEHRPDITVQTALLGSAGGFIPTPPTEMIEIILKENVQAQNYNFMLREVQTGTSSISGFVYVDTNQNGVFDDDEVAVAGSKVTLVGGPINQAVYSDENGEFIFTDLPGNVTYLLGADFNGFPFEGSLTAGSAGGITQNSQGNNMPYITVPNLASGVNATGYLFGKYALPNSASIHGVVFEDSNGNGIQDLNEPGIAGVDVKITGSVPGTPYAGTTVQTKADGSFVFENLAAGTYAITVLAVDGMSDMLATVGSAGGNAKEGSVSLIQLASGESTQGYVFGKKDMKAQINGIVYDDINQNGVFDEDESGLQNVVMTLSKIEAGEITASLVTSTDVNGEFAFTRLNPGIYTLSAGEVQNMKNGFALAGHAGGAAGAGMVSGIVLQDGVQAQGYNFNKYTFTPLVDPYNRALSGVVELIDASKVTSLAHVEVLLKGILVANPNNLPAVEIVTLTDENGVFRFENLPDAIYTLTVGNVEGTKNDSQTPMPTMNRGVLGVISDISIKENTEATGYLFRKSRFAENDPNTVSISGKVFLDTNGNNRFDEGEPGLAGLIIRTGDQSSPIQMSSTVTDENGYYQLVGIVPHKTNTLSIQYGQGHFPGILTHDGTPISSVLVLSPGQHLQGYDFAASMPLNSSSISGVVYEDRNANGIMDAGEYGLGGVEVVLWGLDYRSNAFIEVTVMTDELGRFKFDGLDQGAYDLTVNDLPGFEDGPASDGTTESKGGENGALRDIYIWAGESPEGYSFSKIPN